MDSRPTSPCARAGFSMVEALVCMVLLAALAAVAAAFFPSTRTATEVAAGAQTLEFARAKMEELQAVPAAAYAGDDTLMVDGLRLVRAWRSLPCDLTGDGAAEPDAYHVAVTIGGITLETIRTAPAGLDVLVY